MIWRSRTPVRVECAKLPPLAPGDVLVMTVPRDLGSAERNALAAYLDGLYRDALPAGVRLITLTPGQSLLLARSGVLESEPHTDYGKEKCEQPHDGVELRVRVLAGDLLDSTPYATRPRICPTVWSRVSEPERAVELAVHFAHGSAAYPEGAA